MRICLLRLLWACRRSRTRGCLGLNFDMSFRQSLLETGVAAREPAGYFDHCRFDCGYLPAIERPEVHAIRHAVSKVQKPRNACMGGLRYRSGYVKLKHRFGPCPHLRQASPPGITASSLSVSTLAFTNETDVGVVRVCRPMLLKVGQKRGPVVGQTVFLGIFQ